MRPRKFGPYELIHEIASGGMAEVYLAKTQGLAGFEKHVAIKLIHPNFSQDRQFIRMLINEAKLTVQLQHVNIAQTFDLGRVGDTYYLTMEFVDGADLYHLLRRASQHAMDMPIPAAAHVAHEIAVGLEYAHRKSDRQGNHLGIVHRDISPQNVLVSRAGEVKLVDFGIAKASQRAQETQVGVIKGKYYYMSPEQAWGDRLDPRTDVFSTGIVLYEMLTGQMLYYEEDLHKLLDKVRKADIAMPSNLRDGIPTELERITMRTLRKRAEDRYQSAGELARDLERFLNKYSRAHSATEVTQWVTEVLTKPDPDEQRSEPAPPSGGGFRGLKPGEFRDENSVILDLRDSESGVSQKTTGVQASPPVGKGENTTEEAPTATGKRVSRTVISNPGNRPKPLGKGGGPPRPPRDEDEDEETSTVSLSKPEVMAAAEKIRRRVEQQTGSAVPPKQPSRTDLGSANTQLADTGDDQTIVTEAPWFAPPEDDPSESAPTLCRGSGPGPMHRDATPDSVLPGGHAGTDGLLCDVVEESASSREVTPAPVVSPSIPNPGLSPSMPPPVGPPMSVPLAGAGFHPPSNPGAAPRHNTPPPNPFPAPSPGSQPNLAPAYPVQRGDLFHPSATPPPHYPPSAMPPGMPFPAEQSGVSAVVDLRQRGSRWWLWTLGALALFFVVFLAARGSDEPVADTATIEVTTAPPGANITVDGTALATVSPAVFEDAKPATAYIIETSLPGYQPARREVMTPENGGKKPVVIILHRIRVSLNVTSTPPGAMVYLNGTHKGQTPLEIEGLEPQQAATVELRLKGHRPVFQSLTWGNEDRSKDLRFALKPSKK